MIENILKIMVDPYMILVRISKRLTGKYVLSNLVDELATKVAQDQISKLDKDIVEKMEFRVIPQVYSNEQNHTVQEKENAVKNVTNRTFLMH